MRGDYDYNHASSGNQHAVTIILIAIAFIALGGLFVGLNILDHL
jgi:hypothetical protein